MQLVEMRENSMMPVAFKPYFDKVIETLSEVEPAPQWIPVSEALPEEKGEYLVTYHPRHWDIVENEIKVGLDTFRGKTSWAKKKYQLVIAWCKKPSPYQPESEE